MKSSLTVGSQVTDSSWRSLAVLAALLGVSAVLLGAAGSHAVPLVDAAARHRWDMALQIHYFQAAALMAQSALLATNIAGRKIRLPGFLQVFGTVLFSGSLYLRAVELNWLPGWITPVGGLILLLGWMILIVQLLRSNTR